MILVCIDGGALAAARGKDTPRANVLASVPKIEGVVVGNLTSTNSMLKLYKVKFPSFGPKLQTATLLSCTLRVRVPVGTAQIRW